MLTSITDVVGEKVLVIQLSIECRVNVCLRMVDIVDVVQHVLPGVGRTAVVAGQCEIILEEACVVDLDVPVRILVASVPADVVGVAPRLAAVVLLRLHQGICSLDIAVQILCIPLQTEVERIVLVRFIAADQTDICRLSVIAQAIVLKVRDIA